MKENNKEININFRATKELREKYAFFCKKNSYVLSKRLRILIEKDLRGEIK